MNLAAGIVILSNVMEAESNLNFSGERAVWIEVFCSVKNMLSELKFSNAYWKTHSLNWGYGL
jgi:hypothetical protein